MNSPKIRKDFPILKRKVNGRTLVYLDSAATSQRPRQVVDAIRDFYNSSNANVHRGVHTLTLEATEAYDKARKKVADFVGVKDSDEIIFVRNTDEAINLVAYSWGRTNIGKGDEIVLTIAEHHSNFVPWQQLAKENRATLKIVPVDGNGEIDILAFKKMLTKKTKLATFFHVSNVLGTINDVNRLSSIVHRLAPQAKILIDGAQAVPHMAVKISSIGCDFYAFSGHKMLGPTGIGVLWGKRELLESMPPFQFGGDMISEVKINKSTWSDIPIKFEAGTPNIEGAVALGAAIDYLEKIGMANVRKHELMLTEYALKKLERFPEIEIIGPKDPRKRCGVIAFNLSSVPAHDVATILDSEGVEIRSGYNCAQPLVEFLGFNAPIVRASFYIYNTKEEVDRLVEGIEKVKEVFKLSQKFGSSRLRSNNKRSFSKNNILRLNEVHGEVQ